MKVHPTGPDGAAIETAYTREYVERHFVSRDDVRENYVPKDDFTKRLRAKDEKASEAAAEVARLKDQLVEVTARTSEAEGLRSRLAEMEQQIAARDAREAFSRGGLLGEDGSPAPWTVDLPRHLHSKVGAEMADKADDFNATAHFREWLAAEDGARTTPLAHLLQTGEAAPGPQAASQPPAAPSPAPVVTRAPSGNQGAQTAPPAPRTVAQRQAAYRAQLPAWQAEGKAAGEIARLIDAELAQNRANATSA